MLNSSHASLWLLHVRSAKGEPLTQEEKGQLQAWYDAQDQIELEQLGITPSTNSLTTQINNMLEHIAIITQNIKVRVYEQLLEQQSDIVREQHRLLDLQRKLILQLLLGSTTEL